ncbi:RtcB family protein [Candidatus Woesearchaeota archaeon]|nr:RtcB family protein [Candidatus Woesearchaeota archaeon]
MSIKEIIPNIKQISEVIWEIPQTHKEGMQVPARIYATEKLLNQMEDTVINQLTNVACLPGIVKHALCMPDGHSGYGFPIGGVAAFDPDKGVISPGGIGFDINCGMRLIRTDLTTKEVRPKLKEIVDLLFKTVPAGVGGKGFVPLTKQQFEEIMTVGVKWCVENNYGWKEDLNRIEENGCIKQADASKVSDRAIQRGINQLGTLGSGNHYLEVQMIRAGQIFDTKIAKKLGIFGENQILIMVHCGSRGFGHQIGSDYLQTFEQAMKKYNITVKDRELACAPFNSKEGQDYYKAMACAANMAFANRQVIIHRVREAFAKIFEQDAKKLGMDIIYDVAHNIAKLETFKVDGKKKELLVHRKGSTRSFGPSRKELMPIFRETGQPVLVGGSMEPGSYLCVGTDKADEETFGSTMHGSGRTMSRTQAKKQFSGEKLQKDMQQKGIYIRAVSMSGLAEEAGNAYKDINEVVDTMDIAGVSKKIVALSPIGNVKG